MRIIPFVVFCSLTFALAFVLITRQEPTLAGAASNEVLPALSVVTLEGNKPWDTAQLRGHVTFINFFASWCAPCAAEMPELSALKKRFPQLKMAGVVWNDKPAATKTFFKQNGNPFTSLWLDPEGSAGISLGIRGIPESFIVDSQGIVRYRLGAMLTPELREKEIDALLTKLLTEASHAK